MSTYYCVVGYRERNKHRKEEEGGVRWEKIASIIIYQNK